MTVKIRVWGNFDKDSKTPLLFEETYELASYSQAREQVRFLLQEHNGKNAHADCEGPNQNYNSIWVAG
jgi:hypothetical protein